MIINMKTTTTVYSPAKINLGLDIARRLENGYHVVRMIMQTLDLCDEVTVSILPREETAGEMEPAITLACPGTDLPTDERNLAYKAAALLLDEFFPEPCDRDFRIGITIRKKIPVAAGLAGGSGNAAAVLRAVNELCGLGLSEKELCTRGLTLGADVPYCLMQGTCLAEGIGEELTRLPDLTEGCVLLVKPDIGVSTKWAYESWDQEQDPYHPDIDGMAQQLSARSKSDAEVLLSIVPFLGNSFESFIMKRYPEVRRIRDDLLTLGAAGALMSGSGPTVFGIYRDDKQMADASKEMARRYPKAFTAQTHVTGKV